MNVIRMEYKKSLHKSEPYTDTIVYIREYAPQDQDSYTPDFTSSFGNFNGNNICGEYSDSGWRTIDEAAEICANNEYYGESFLEEKIVVKKDSCLIGYCIDKPELASKNFTYIIYREQSADCHLKYCYLQVGAGVFDQTFCQFRVTMEKCQLVIYEGNKAIFKKRFKTYGR